MRLSKEKVDELCDKYGFHMNSNNRYNVHMCTFNGVAGWDQNSLNEICAFRIKDEMIDPQEFGFIFFGVNEKLSMENNHIETISCGTWLDNYEQIEYVLEKEQKKIKRLKKKIRMKKIEEL